MLESSPSPIATILVAQFVVVCVLSVVLLGFDKVIAASAFVGGLICIVPNAYLAQRLTAKRTADPQKLINALYSAEIGKIVITGLLFATVFATQEWIQPISLLGGFGIAQLTHWFTPLLSKTKSKT